MIKNGITLSRLDFEGYMEASRLDERERIIKIIRERIEDFNHCSKNDCCGSAAFVLEGLIEDVGERW
jgi:hypothetical protein